MVAWAIVTSIEKSLDAVFAVDRLLTRMPGYRKLRDFGSDILFGPAQDFEYVSRTGGAPPT